MSEEATPNPPDVIVPPAPEPEPKPREQLEGELARRRAEQEKLSAELEKFKAAEAERKEAERLKAEEEAKAKGEFEKLLTEREAELAAAKERLAALQTAEEARTEAKRAEVQAMLSGRTDAEALATKAAAIAGDDPYRQHAFLTEIIGASRGTAATGGTPDRGSEATGEPGRADLTPEEIEICERTADMLGQTVEERIKTYARHKREAK